MFPRRLVVGALALLLLFGLLIGASGAAQRDAWMQGYMVGRLSAGGEGDAAAPLAPYFYGGGYRGPHFGGLGLIFVLGLLFFLFGAVGKFFRCWGWRHSGGPGGGPWGRHGYGPPGWGRQQPPESEQGASSRPHRHSPPWWGRERPSEAGQEQTGSRPGTGGEYT
ncbi:MAG TPA: hypothetical protein VER55_08495 [Ardenticatenaceae bacterium]|nr:hypothetical protein [Ardenticatenaceae bacterium]